jgi:hypothetical protein
MSHQSKTIVALTGLSLRRQRGYLQRSTMTWYASKYVAFLQQAANSGDGHLDRLRGKWVRRPAHGLIRGQDLFTRHGYPLLPGTNRGGQRESTRRDHRRRRSLNLESDLGYCTMGAPFSAPDRAS